MKPIKKVNPDVIRDSRFTYIKVLPIYRSNIKTTSIVKENFKFDAIKDPC